MSDSTTPKDQRHRPASKDEKPRPRSLDPDPDEPPDTKTDRDV